MEPMNNLDTLVSMTNGLCQLVWNGNVERKVQTKISYKCKFSEQALQCNWQRSNRGTHSTVIACPRA